MRCGITGLTGGIGSGKSTVSAQLGMMGYDIVDADLLTRLVQRDATVCAAIASAFGASVMERVGGVECISRKALGARVFGDDDAMGVLNRIMRPALRQAAQAAIESSSGPVILDAALLYEAGWEDLVDRVVVVVSQEGERARRVAARDGMDLADVRRRMARQMTDAERVRRADSIIYNVGSFELLSAQVRRIFG